MKCIQCKENLVKYIEGDLSAEVYEDIKEHLLICESCRSVYDEEMLEYEAFKAAYSIDEVKFESITPRVIGAIDKNKYLSEVKIRKVKYMAPIVAVLFICVAISPFVLNYINRGEKNNIDTMDLTKSIQLSSEEENEIIINEKEKDNTSSVDSYESLNDINYVDLYSIKSVKNPTIESNTAYISSSDGVYEATLAGKGEYAQKEGIGIIYIKNNNNNEFIEVKLKNTDKQISPLAISWYDEKNIMIVQGDAYETLANGIDIIVINVESGDQRLIATVEDSPLIRFEHVYRDGNDLVIDMKKYTDELMNEFNEYELRAKDYKLGDIIN